MWVRVRGRFRRLTPRLQWDPGSRSLRSKVVTWDRGRVGVVDPLGRVRGSLPTVRTGTVLPYTPSVPAAVETDPTTLDVDSPDPSPDCDPGKTRDKLIYSKKGERKERRSDT